jgi:hypothetical protein
MSSFSAEEIVKDYKDGKLTTEQALDKIGTKYNTSLIDIKKEMHDQFEIFQFYRKVPCDVDEYINACDRLENSPSPQERENYETIIQKIINGVKTDCDDVWGQGQDNSSSTAILNVRKEVDKIREFCRQNRETKELYEKYKAKIEAGPDTPEKSQTPSLSLPQEDIIPENVPRILKDLIDAGQLSYKNGKYTPNKSMPDFISWCSENGYIEVGDKKDKYKDDLTPQFVFDNIIHGCTLETINRYFRSTKQTKEK